VIAVDTNVLARLILQDEPDQHAIAHRLFEAQAGEAGSIWISDVVLAELVWVLTRAGGCSRPEVVTVLRALLSNATVRLASPGAVEQALALYEAGPADFADCLLAAQAHGQGAQPVMTFDRKMRALPGIQVL
jgi:predicted nucleic-acid-binding protein